VAGRTDLVSAPTVASRSEGLGDTALSAATGRTWAEWFSILDAAGAAGWTHPQIASWLRDTHDVPPWWCQTVTVGFEQDRGLRQPGQRSDGSFEVSASKTLAGELPAVLDAVIDAVSAGVGSDPVSESRDITYPTARWNLASGEYVVARANPPKNGKTSVSLTHHRMAAPEQVAPAKAALRTWLAGAGS
jgi:hypothetical protein